MKKRIIWILLIVTAFILTTPGCTLLSNSTTAPTTNSVLTPTNTYQTTQTDFVSVVAKGRPSVVAITTETSVTIFGRVFTQEGAGS